MTLFKATPTLFQLLDGNTFCQVEFINDEIHFSHGMKKEVFNLFPNFRPLQGFAPLHGFENCKSMGEVIAKISTSNIVSVVKRLKAMRNWK